MSTTFFKFFGSEKWYFLPCIWALVPFANIFFFAVVPLAQKITEESGMPFKRLVKSKIFLICLVMMICAGSIEMAMAQWASLFAEAGLGVSKEVGDILGPCMFAVFMGLARMMYGIYGASLKLHKALVISAVFALVSYLVTVFSRSSITALISASMCGLAVGIMWPGTFSISSAMLTKGGTAMFALLAMAGDLGGSIGPGIVGRVTQSAGDNIRAGIGVGLVFPVTLLLMLFILARQKTRK